jgi:hypothetical protein
VLAGTVEVGEPCCVAARRPATAVAGQVCRFIDQHAGRGLLPELPVLDNVALQLRFGGQPADVARRTAGALARLGLEAAGAAAAHFRR